MQTLYTCSDEEREIFQGLYAITLFCNVASGMLDMLATMT